MSEPIRKKKTYPLARKWRRGRIRHIIIALLTTLTLLLSALLVFLFTVFSGPSPALSDRIISTLNETSALKFLPYLFMPEEEVEAALIRTSYVAVDTITNTSLYHFSADEDAGSDGESSGETGEFAGRVTSGLAVADEDPSSPAATPAATAAPEEKDDPYGAGEGIEIIRIVGPTYKGYLAIIDDPSRVSVGISSDFRSGLPGKRIEEFAEDYGAVLAVNGGAFSDPYGTGNGGTPGGLVISDGVLYHGATKYCEAACFDQENRLIVGEISTEEAKRLGIRDAVGFGPVLIVNGEPAQTGSNASLNPRTAIGQRADGAVLLLVVDGRQLDSLGASMADLIAVMQEYEAINACNLDGGSSSVMLVNGKQLNDGVAVTGSRRIPTTIIVR